MDPVTLFKVYCIGILMFYGYFVRFTNGQTYTFEPVTFTEAKNRCMLADESTICDPSSEFCEPRSTISNTSLIDSVSTWIDGFYYKSVWVFNTGCYYILATDLDRIAVKYDLGSINNVENCAVRCGNSSFYGLVSDKCYCIDGAKSYLSNVPLSSCDTSCPGNPSEKCGSPRGGLLYLTVYETLQDTVLSEPMDEHNCRAVSYTASDNYTITSRNCSEKLSFACRPNSVGPQFLNFGNSTWEEANQFCLGMEYLLSDAFYIDFSNQDSYRLNTSYWIAHFRVEQNYWGQDLPQYQSDDPKPECLSISGTAGNYQVMRNDCTSSKSAFCLQNVAETSTGSEQSTSQETTTMEPTTMETTTVDMTTMSTTTDQPTETSSEENTESTAAATTVQTTTESDTTNEATTTTTMATETTSDSITSTTTESTTTSAATSTTSPTTTTSQTSSAVPVVPGGQAAQQTSNAGVYVGVPMALIIGAVCVLLVVFLVMRHRKNKRRYVYRIDGPQRSSNPILDLEYPERRSNKAASKAVNMSTFNNKRRDPDGGSGNDVIGDDAISKAQNRMTTGPLTEQGVDNIVDLEAADNDDSLLSNDSEQDDIVDEIDETAPSSLYDKPKNNGSIKRTSIESSHSNEIAVPLEGEGDHNDIVVSTENLIQLSEEEEEEEEEVEEENTEPKDGLTVSGIENKSYSDDE